MSRKERTFNQLLSYIDLPIEKGEKPILFNLRSIGDSSKKIGNEFLKNSQLCRARKNGVYLYHEILSFSEGDRGVVNEDILQDLAEHYLQLRAPGALAYGRVHFNKGNPHVHLMISANEINSQKKIRLSKSRFTRIKREIEAYQKTYYPELTNSIAQDKNTVKISRKNSEFEREKRLKKEKKQILSRKEKVRIIFLQKLNETRTEKLFERALKEEGFVFHQRGKTLGIKDQEGKKYRLKTLGVMDNYKKRSAEWSRKKYRKSVLVEIEKDKIRKQFRGFKKSVLSVLDTPFSTRSNQLWGVNRRNNRQFFRGRGR